jgi:hypothetical protein
LVIEGFGKQKKDARKLKNKKEKEKKKLCKAEEEKGEIEKELLAGIRKYFHFPPAHPLKIQIPSRKHAKLNPNK